KRSVSGPAPAKKPIECVLIASSTGGPAALREVLTRIPHGFPLPIVIAQHMPPTFTQSLAETLDRDCPLKVTEAAAGMVVSSGNVYLLPGGAVTRLVGRTGRLMFEVATDSKETGPRPSANALFTSAAKCTDGRVLAVVLTGMGEDGKEGCDQLRSLGATIIAQDEASCVVYGMPRAVAEAGLVDEVIPLAQIAGKIQRCVSASASRGCISLPDGSLAKFSPPQGTLR
ncbi:MAG: chemotaxis protein CheB, partial [Planctomycetales bacterium]|nr:chemotaxis protein CheB [Planctomycetales bacterium]